MMKFLEYRYDESITEYLNNVGNLFSSLKDRGLIGLEILSRSGYIKDYNNAIVFLLRNVVAYIDGLAISATVPNVENMKILARGFLEAKFYLDYIFKENTDERAIAYQNNYLIERIKKYRKLDSSTEEGRRFSESWGQDRIFSTIEKCEIDTRELITNLKLQLNKEPFRSVYEKQSAFKKASKWYTFDTGKKSLRGLCEYLKCQIEYEIYYSNWSGIIHSTSAYEDNIYHGRIETGMQYIRSINGYKDIIVVLFPLIMELYTNIFKVADKDYYYRLIRYFKNIYFPRKNQILSVEIKVQA